jgi:hypothetical protein
MKTSYVAALTLTFFYSPLPLSASKEGSTQALMMKF